MVDPSKKKDIHVGETSMDRDGPEDGKRSSGGTAAPRDIAANRWFLPDFGKFKQSLLDRFPLSPEAKQQVSGTRVSDLYSIAGVLNQPASAFARTIAEHLGLPYVADVICLDAPSPLLSVQFSRWNRVAPVSNEEGRLAFLISNPFDWQLLDVLEKQFRAEGPLRLIVADPLHILSFLDKRPDRAQPEAGGETTGRSPLSIGNNGEQETAQAINTVVMEDVGPVTEAEIEQRPIVQVSNNILYRAVTERASDVHIEPKEKETLVRYRIDGDLQDVFHLKNQTGVMVISRLKALAGMDISERMKPQDGVLEILVGERMFKLRLATTSTPSGQSLIVRLLEPTAKPNDLRELGMKETQVATMKDFSTRSHGLILVVGPTGSGKTTTIYSFLSHVDTKLRSLISVEDPVEYRIPNANQQQVNEKAGVTFDALLRSTVRQDPDILYLGEIRDSFSARISVDFASTGHLTISTLHTNNATTAIFRLERLGVTREVMVEALLGIVAQRLLKRLCPHCKRVAPITDKEIEILRPYTTEMPAQVAHPVGCPKCRGGYFGREAVYEILAFDQDVLDRVRSGMPISELRQFIQERGGYLISHHAVDKVKELIFPVNDIYEKVLVEEIPLRRKEEEEVKPDKPAEPAAPRGRSTILVVEDDQDNQVLISRILTNAGYAVSVAGDGIDALMFLAKQEFDLILSDINMPNLDGFKFLEILKQKGIRAPLIFLTARMEEEDEVRGLELGALDYLKKPVKKDALLLRVKLALGRRVSVAGEK